MRKYLLVILLMFTAAQILPQTTVTIESVSATAGEDIIVPINVENFNDVGAISFKINYDTNLLTFVGIDNAPVTFTVNAAGGVLSLSWFDATASQPINIASGGLLDLQFNYVGGGNTTIAFNTAESEVANSVGDPIAVTYVDGTVQEAGNTIGLSFGSVIDPEIGSVQVPLNVSGFSAVGAVSIRFSYDTSVMEFVGINNAPNSDFTANESSGVVTIGWFDLSGNSPLTVDDGALLDVEFNFTGGFTEVVFDEGATEISNNVGQPFNLEFESGFVGSIVTLDIGDVTVGGPGVEVEVPIEVSSFDDVGALSLKIQYNAAVLEFVEVRNAVNDIGITANASQGVLTLGWFDLTGNSPLTFGSGTLVDLVFNYVDGQTNLDFIEAQSEVSNSLGNALEVNYVSGSVSQPQILDVTIRQIQEVPPPPASDASPFVGALIRTTGIVTGIDEGTGYYIQDGSGPWNGVWVYDVVNVGSVAIGDEVTIACAVEEYFGLTELNYSDNPLGFSINSSGNPLPEPVVISTGNFNEPYEGVYVQFQNVTVTNDDLGFGEWEGNDGSGPAVIDDQLIDFTPVLGVTYSYINGVGNYSFGAYKLEPNSADAIPLMPEGLLGLDHETTNLAVTAINDGNIGALSGLGRGIEWKGYNGLWRSAIVYGRESAGYAVGDAHQNSVGFADLANVQSDFRLGLQTEGDYSVTTAVVTDANADSPYGLNVIQKTYSTADQDVVFYRYGFVNNTEEDLTDLYAGMFIDYDIDDYTNNEGGVSITDQLVYQYINDANPYFGAVSINDEWAGRVASSNLDDADAFREAALEYISTVNFAAPPTGDQRSWIGAKVPDVAPGEVGWVTFGIVAGDDLDGIRANARNAVEIAHAQGWTHIHLPAPEALAGLDHESGDLVVTAINDGNIGALSGLGRGVEWKGYNGLWRAAAVYGRESAGYAVGDAHNYSVGFADLTNVASNFAAGFDEFGAYQVTEAIFTDGNADNPYGLNVIQETYSAPNGNAVFYRYGFINNTSGTISDLHAGIFLDYDVDDYTANYGGVSEAERLIYEYQDDNNPYFGAVAITPTEDDDWGGKVTPVDIDELDALREGAFEYISTLDPSAPEVGDQRMWIGQKVEPIPPGEVGWATFAIVAGDNLIDLRTNAEVAYINARTVFEWTDVIVSVDPNEVENAIPETYSLAQNYPNPFNPTTTIRYGLPSASQVKIVVYNLLGEVVGTLVDSQKPAGYHNINFDASRLSSGVYFYTITAKSVEGGKDFNSVKKMMLVK